MIGRRLYQALSKRNVDVAYFIDQSRKGYRGVTCVLPEESQVAPDVDVIVITPGYDEQNIRKTLSGVSALIVRMEDLFAAKDMESFRKLLLRQNENKFAVSERCWDEAFDQYKRVLTRYSQWMTTKELCKRTREARKHLINKDIILPRIELVMTTKCSLKCKKCFAAIPDYSRKGSMPFDIPIDTLLGDFEQLLLGVDFIVQVNLLGGEPFLYEQIDELLSWLAGSDKVGRFLVVTNGTVIPKDSTCRLLADGKFYVQIDDYRLPEGRAMEIASLFSYYGVMHHITRDQRWFDFGNVEKKRLSKNQLVDQYRKCDYSVCKSLMEGELFTCEFHEHRTKLKMIPDAKDSLRLHDYADDELRVAMIEFYNRPYFSACDYCTAPNKKTSPYIPAGEQEGES